MASVLKAVLSLLLTVLTFAGCYLLAITGGMQFLELHYYQPRKVHAVNHTLDAIAREFDDYADELLLRFAEYALDDATASYLERDADADAATRRTEVTGRLFQQTTGLEGIRIVENGSLHVHYSTYESDILLHTDALISYRNYDLLGEIPFAALATTDTGEYAGSTDAMLRRCTLYFDAGNDRLIFSYPFFDAYTAYRGTILFYIYADDFTERLAAKNIIPLSTRTAVIAPEGGEANLQSPANTGLAFGVPAVGKALIVDKVARNWQDKRYSIGQLVELPERQDALILLTSTRPRLAKIGWICSEHDFLFSSGERWLLYVCLFITLFLFLLIISNLKADDMVVIRHRVHAYEIAFVREYLHRKHDADWQALAKDIALHRHDMNGEIRKGLGYRARRHSRELNDLLDETWNELMGVMGKPSAAVQIPHPAQPAPPGQSATAPLYRPEEDLEELPAADDEPLEELPSADDEELEELEALPDDFPNQPDAEEREAPPAIVDAKALEALPPQDGDAAELEELPPEDDDAAELEELPLEDDDAIALEELPPEPELFPGEKTPGEKRSAAFALPKHPARRETNDIDVTPDHLREAVPAASSRASLSRAVEAAPPDFTWLNEFAKTVPDASDNKNTETDI